MVAQTLERLKTTFFGNDDDGVGECYDTSLIVLRFFTSAAPDETKWMQDRIINFHNHYNEKHRSWFTQRYFWLCLSELPYELAKPEILMYKDEIITFMSKSCVMNSENDRLIHPVIICIIRNMIARLPEYRYLQSRKPYLSAKDGRLHFDIN